jgi:hypothetical protein
LTAVNTPQIAQYAPNIPRTTLKIAVPPIKNATENALTVLPLAGSRSSDPLAIALAIARLRMFSLYSHLTPAAVNN